MVCFKIGTRSSYQLEIVLGPDYDGTIMCDCYQVYFSFMKKCSRITLQLCLAHVLREFKYCADFMEPTVAEYGRRGLGLLREIFGVYHQYADMADKDGQPARQLRDKLLELKGRMVGSALDAPRDYARPRLLAERFEEFGEYYFSFIDNPHVEPTNNEAERCLRSIVIDRKICYGTQSRSGIFFCETIWSILGTLKKKGIEPMPFLIETLQAHKNGQPLPSLANVGGHVDPSFVERARLEKEEILKEKKAASAQARGTGHGTPNPSAIDPAPGPADASRPPAPRQSPPGKGGPGPVPEAPGSQDWPPGPNPPTSSEEPRQEERMPRHADDMPGPGTPGVPGARAGTATIDARALLRGIRSAKKARTGAPPPKGGAPKNSHGPNAAARPPKAPSHRRVLAPEPALKDLEPARMGPVASL
jgi:hypothetical protein